MVCYFQSLANLLGLTKSEAAELLSALGRDKSSQQTAVSRDHAHSAAPLCITAFLGCFEFASVGQQGKEPQDTRPDDKAGPSGVGTVNSVAVRKGLSNEITIQLCKSLTVEHTA